VFRQKHCTNDVRIDIPIQESDQGRDCATQPRAKFSLLADECPFHLCGRSCWILRVLFAFSVRRRRLFSCGGWFGPGPAASPSYSPLRFRHLRAAAVLPAPRPISWSVLSFPVPAPLSSNRSLDRPFDRSRRVGTYVLILGLIWVLSACFSPFLGWEGGTASWFRGLDAEAGEGREGRRRWRTWWGRGCTAAAIAGTTSASTTTLSPRPFRWRAAEFPFRSWGDFRFIPNHGPSSSVTVVCFFFRHSNSSVGHPKKKR
jgi:hypothetical protein